MTFTGIDEQIHFLALRWGSGGGARVVRLDYFRSFPINPGKMYAPCNGFIIFCRLDEIRFEAQFFYFFIHVRLKFYRKTARFNIEKNNCNNWNALNIDINIGVSVEVRRSEDRYGNAPRLFYGGARALVKFRRPLRRASRALSYCVLSKRKLS